MTAAQFAPRKAARAFRAVLPSWALAAFGVCLCIPGPFDEAAAILASPGAACGAVPQSPQRLEWRQDAQEGGSEMNARVEWSDYRDWEADNATPREAIDASPHRETFMAALAKFAAKANSHETVDVRWWGYPRIYIGVTDSRLEYPTSSRALVSFDLTNGKLASYDSEHRYVFARRGWISFMTDLLHYAPPVYDEDPPEVPDGQVIVIGRPQEHASFRRYHLSNGWFIDHATRAPGHYGGWKYALFEPGGHPSGGAGLRGGAPTLALALAAAPAAPKAINGAARKVAGTVTIAVTERQPLALTGGAS